MNDNDQKKIQFANDQAMNEAIFDLILATYLKKRSGEDVNLKAGRMIAIELLEDAWKVVESYKVSGAKQETPTNNVGL